MFTDKKWIVVCWLQTLFFSAAFSQDAQSLLQKVKAKMDKVRDYTATGMMKTDVLFIKAPVSKIKSFFLYPDRFKIQRDGGVSLLPKGGVSINLRSLLLTESYTIVDAGVAGFGKDLFRVLKLLPLDEQSDIVLSTLYIDEKNLLIRKSSTTTRQNGTYEMEMLYGNYSRWGLPDKIIFAFNTKDYKLPKGITFEYDDGTASSTAPKNKKGRVEIVYQSYSINKGLRASDFE